jgi:hypothetical protein
VAIDLLGNSQHVLTYSGAKNSKSPVKAALRSSKEEPITGKAVEDKPSQEKTPIMIFIGVAIAAAAFVISRILSD